MKYHYLPILLLAGCATHPAPVSHTDDFKIEPPKPNLDLRDAVMVPGAVAEYSTGPYTDPDDPDILHTGGPVYRQETSPHWNLNPMVPPPSVERIGASSKREVLTAELEEKINQEDQLLQTTFEQNQQMTEQLKQIQESLPTSPAPTEQPSSSFPPPLSSAPNPSPTPNTESSNKPPEPSKQSWWPSFWSTTPK